MRCQIVPYLILHVTGILIFVTNVVKMPLALSGSSSSAAPIPPFKENAFGHLQILELLFLWNGNEFCLSLAFYPMLMSIAATSFSTICATFNARSALAVPICKTTFRFSASHVRNTTVPSCLSMKSTVFRTSKIKLKIPHENWTTKLYAQQMLTYHSHVDMYEAVWNLWFPQYTQYPLHIWVPVAVLEVYLIQTEPSDVEQKRRNVSKMKGNCPIAQFTYQCEPSAPKQFYFCNPSAHCPLLRPFLLDFSNLDSMISVYLSPLFNLLLQFSEMSQDRIVPCALQRFLSKECVPSIITAQSERFNFFSFHVNICFE